MIELQFFFKYASPTQCSTCTVKCTFRKCNAPFPSATVMSQLGVQSCFDCGDRQVQCFAMLSCAAKKKDGKILVSKKSSFCARLLA